MSQAPPILRDAMRSMRALIRADRYLVLWRADDSPTFETIGAMGFASEEIFGSELLSISVFRRTHSSQEPEWTEGEIEEGTLTLQLSGIQSYICFPLKFETGTALLYVDDRKLAGRFNYTDFTNLANLARRLRNPAPPPPAQPQSRISQTSPPLEPDRYPPLSRSPQPGRLFPVKVSLRDLAVFARQWHAMVQASVPLQQSLEALAGTQDGPLGEALQDCCQRLAAGHRLSMAFAPHHHLFGDVFLAMLKIGEQTGSLLGQMDRYALLLERRYEFQRKLISASIYPIFLGFCSLALVALFALVLMPAVAPFLRGLPVQLPLATRCLLAVCAVLERPLTWLALVGVLWLLAWELPNRVRNWRSQPEFAIRMDSWLWVLPGVGPAYRALQRTTAMLTLATGVEVGMGPVQALQLAREACSNRHLGSQLERLSQSILEGESLQSGLRHCSAFPTWHASLLGTAEESGSLASGLRHLARLSEQEALNAIETACQLAEPLLLTLMAGVAAFLALATLAPIATVLSVL